MKDSGIEWIGDIPVDWNKTKFKYLTPLRMGGTWGSEPETDDNGIPCFRVADFNFENLTIRDDDITIRNVEIDDEHPRILKKGDLIVEKSGGGEKTPVGRTVLYNFKYEKAVCSNFTEVLHHDKSIVLPKFTCYLHARNYYINLNKRHIKQTTGIQNLDLDSYLDEYCFLPSKQEQTQIVAFLDKKTAKIDTLIANKERKIELLKEKRKALINQAVTKGLDPNVQMKDSGIELLGNIPKHWERAKMKYLTKLINDGTHSSFSRRQEGYRLLSVRNIVNGKFVFLYDDSKISEEDLKKITKSFAVQEKDIQLAIVGATLGKAAIVPALPEPFATQRSIATIRVRDNKINHQFLFNYINSSYFQKYLWLNAGYTAQPGVYLGTLKNAVIPLPPIEEQMKIIKYLNSECENVDYLIGSETKKIDLLKEYRQSLISEVVTGKIDVRDEVDIASVNGQPARRSLGEGGVAV